jgi:dTDP-4-dehydrorhamnose reductase
MTTAFHRGPIAVTGALGLLGANLVVENATRGCRTLALARKEFPDWPLVQSACCDLRDVGRLSAILEQEQPASIVHCAALTNVDWCESNPEAAKELHVDVSRELAAIARQIGAKFVYISTDSVFDGETGGYFETDPTNPLNVYARTKLAGEVAVVEAYPDSLLIRTNLYGWNLQLKNSLAEWVLGKLESSTSFPGFQDVIFNPLLVNDLADLILEMLAGDFTGLYHVAASDACSKFEFAVRLASVFGLNGNLIQPASSADIHFKARRPGNTSLDTSRFVKALGRRTPTVLEGLQRFQGLRASGFVGRLKDAYNGVSHG